MALLLGRPVPVEPLPPGTVIFTLLKVTLLTWWLPSAPQIVGLYVGLLLPTMVMLS